MPNDIGRRFSPAVVAFGFVLIAAGSLVLFLYYRVIHVMPLVVLIGALLALPAGLSCILFFSFVDSCRRCGKELEFKKVAMSASGGDGLKRALERSPVGDLIPLVSRYATSPSPESIQLTCWYCPQCRAVGFLKVPGRPRRVVSGADVGSILAAMSGRGPAPSPAVRPARR